MKTSLDTQDPDEFWTCIDELKQMTEMDFFSPIDKDPIMAEFLALENVYQTISLKKKDKFVIHNLDELKWLSKLDDVPCLGYNLERVLLGKSTFKVYAKGAWLRFIDFEKYFEKCVDIYRDFYASISQLIGSILVSRTMNYLDEANLLIELNSYKPEFDDMAYTCRGMAGLVKYIRANSVGFVIERFVDSAGYRSDTVNDREIVYRIVRAHIEEPCFHIQQLISTEIFKALSFIHAASGLESLYIIDGKVDPKLRSIVLLTNFCGLVRFQNLESLIVKSVISEITRIRKQKQIKI